MLLNRPKGISINKNALNIQPLQANQPNKKTPSPPNLKSLLATRQQSQQQPLDLLKPSLKEYQELKPLLPIQEVKQQQQETHQERQQPLKKISENDDVAPVGQPSLPKPQPIITRQTSKIPRLVEQLDESIEDIDNSPTSDAVHFVSDVANDIYSYMFKLEDSQSIKEDYLKDQKIYTPKLRQRLVNWCIEYCLKLELLHETLYMTISLMDRFFERASVKHQNQVQLVALGAILVASKYEEIYPPELKDLLCMTRNAYSKRDILRMEIEILERLNFDLGRPVPLSFLRRFSKAAHCDLRMHAISKFLMELSLTEYECSHWKPSFLAATALFTTIHLVHQQKQTENDRRSTLNSSTNFGLCRRLAFSTNGPSLTFTKSPPITQDRWNKTLVHYTHYTRKDLQGSSGTLCKILKKALKSPQLYATAKEHTQRGNLANWPELKSTRVDELIRLGDLMQQQI